MAEHIKSVASSGIPKVSQAVFYATMQPGDLVFCWGDALISRLIEKFTDGGPSHVLKVWLPWRTGPWLTLEAEIGYGVRMGQFSDYMEYPGDIVLCRRKLTNEMVQAELTFGSTLLDYKYDTIEFASLVARRFNKRFPLMQPQKHLYCSGLQQAIAAVSVPYGVPDVPWATPEQLFTDTTVETICALLRQ